MLKTEVAFCTLFHVRRTVRKRRRVVNDLHPTPLRHDQKQPICSQRSDLIAITMKNIDPVRRRPGGRITCRRRINTIIASRGRRPHRIFPRAQKVNVRWGSTNLRVSRTRPLPKQRAFREVTIGVHRLEGSWASSRQATRNDSGPSDRISSHVVGVKDCPRRSMYQDLWVRPWTVESVTGQHSISHCTKRALRTTTSSLSHAASIVINDVLSPPQLIGLKFIDRVPNVEAALPSLCSDGDFAKISYLGRHRNSPSRL